MSAQLAQIMCCCGPGSCLTDCTGCPASFRVRIQGLQIQCTSAQTLVNNCSMPVIKNVDPSFPCMWWNPTSTNFSGDCAFAGFGQPKLTFQLRCGTVITGLPALPEPRWIVLVFIPANVCGGLQSVPGLIAYTRGSPQTCPQLGQYTFWAASIGGTLMSPGVATLEAA